MKIITIDESISKLVASLLKVSCFINFIFGKICCTRLENIDEVLKYMKIPKCSICKCLKHKFSVFKGSDTHLIKTAGFDR